jgi:aminoglycoside phosphotransferase (APT) family kinase protein
VTRDAVDADRVGAVVGRHLGQPHAIEGLRRLSGGASRETWSFVAVGPSGERLPLVLRLDPPASASMGPQVDEYALIRAAGEAGVPVPPLRFRLDEVHGLGSGFVSDLLEGETLGRRIVRDEAYAVARTDMARELGRILAALHSVPVASLPLEPPRAGSSAQSQLDLFEKVLDGYDVARPVLELALRWLRENEAPEAATVLVHGDFRVGNVIVDPGGIRAVLDWELAHIGDPAEDIGWLCTRSWRFGGTGRVGGVGDLDDLLDAYRQAGGPRVSADAVHYWEVFGNLRWGVIAVAQAFSHLTGARRSVELAAIGRRVTEVEHDLMELLG